MPLLTPANKADAQIYHTEMRREHTRQGASWQEESSLQL